MTLKNDTNFRAAARHRQHVCDAHHMAGLNPCSVYNGEISMTNTILRHGTPASLTESWAREFSESIEIPPNAATIVLSGVGALPLNPGAPSDTIEHFGDTRAQTRSIFDQISKILLSRGFSMADIVVMQGLFVADPKNGNRPDYKAFSDVYWEYFGSTQQPHLPTRTRSQIVGLVEPGWLVEVTVTAAKMKVL